MLYSVFTTFALLIASVVASPAPVVKDRDIDASPVVAARAAGTTIYVRIEGPTHTIYEKTIVASAKASLTNNGHTAPCQGPSGKHGVTSLVALSETGQFFKTSFGGGTFTGVTEINKTANNSPNYPNHEWFVALNDEANGGQGGFPTESGTDFCDTIIPDKQHLLFAYIPSTGVDQALIMSGPATAKVGQTVQYEVPFAPKGTYVNDLSQDDTTTGQRVRATFAATGGSTASVSITFKNKGTYNMKAHCPDGSSCLRSNHVVTVVS